MINLTIKTTPDLQAWEQGLLATENQLIAAATRALNKTARWAITQTASQTAKALSIKVGAVRSGLVLVRARRSRLESAVGLSQNAGSIKAINLGSATQNSNGVRVARRQFDRAFLATMPSGHQGVFRRRGKTRLPIQEVHIVITKKMGEVLEALSDGPAMLQFELLFQRELRYLLRTV